MHFIFGIFCKPSAHWMIGCISKLSCTILYLAQPWGWLGGEGSERNDVDRNGGFTVLMSANHHTVENFYAPVPWLMLLMIHYLINYLVYTYPQQPSKKKNSTSHFRAMGREAQKNSLISPNLEHYQKWSWFKTKGIGISIILFQCPLMSGSFALVVDFVWHASSSVVLDFVIAVHCFVFALALRSELKPGIVAHIFNPSTQEQR